MAFWRRINEQHHNSMHVWVCSFYNHSSPSFVLWHQDWKLLNECLDGARPVPQPSWSTTGRVRKQLTSRAGPMTSQRVTLSLSTKRSPKVASWQAEWMKGKGQENPGSSMNWCPKSKVLWSPRIQPGIKDYKKCPKDLTCGATYVQHPAMKRPLANSCVSPLDLPPFPALSLSLSFFTRQRVCLAFEISVAEAGLVHFTKYLHTCMVVVGYYFFISFLLNVFKFDK